MPHLIIEHSSNISKEAVISLQKDIQKIMSQSEGGFTIDGCKARAFFFDEYLVGSLDQNESSFIHITLKILAGRSLEIRKSLSNKIMDYLRKFVSDLSLDRFVDDSNVRRFDISVDIVEMDRETYGKDSIL